MEVVGADDEFIVFDDAAFVVDGADGARRWWNENGYVRRPLSAGCENVLEERICPGIWRERGMRN